MGNRASAFTWAWGNPGELGLSHVVGSTGAGVAFNTGGWGERFTFEVETNDSNWAYEIRVGRTAAGPWRTLSSNAGTSTGIVDIVQFPGPFRFLAPNVSGLASTANYLIIRMEAIES